MYYLHFDIFTHNIYIRLLSKNITLNNLMIIINVVWYDEKREGNYSNVVHIVLNYWN